MREIYRERERDRYIERERDKEIKRERDGERKEGTQIPNLSWAGTFAVSIGVPDINHIAKEVLGIRVGELPKLLICWTARKI